jgi:hypothetical protein
VSNLHPFFCFYGGKWRSAKRYPKPTHKTVIEPFAGSAGYSLRHPDRDVVLYDLDPTICGVWEYLIKSSSEEIARLPVEIDHIDEVDAPQEAKWLIGFWLNKGGTTPKLTPSAWMRSGIRPNSYWGEVIRARIASQVDSIRHWKIHCQSYNEIENEEATWFVDPPYFGKAGRCYRCKFNDYNELAQWCRNRLGQVMVCERAGADWLPFEPFAKIKSTPGARGKSYSEEMIWKNF